MIFCHCLEKKEVVDFVVERVRRVQDFLEIPFALKHLSSNAHFTDDEMPEWEFYTTIVEKADISMMLDVNNIYISSRNEGYDPKEYVLNLPLDRVVQIHLAGHCDYGRYVLDTHDHPVSDEVWEIYAEVYPRTRGVSTLLEWCQATSESDPPATLRIDPPLMVSLMAITA